MSLVPPLHLCRVFLLIALPWALASHLQKHVTLGAEAQDLGLEKEVGPGSGREGCNTEWRTKEEAEKPLEIDGGGHRGLVPRAARCATGVAGQD